MLQQVSLLSITLFAAPVRARPAAEQEPAQAGKVPALPSASTPSVCKATPPAKALFGNQAGLRILLLRFQDAGQAAAGIEPSLAKLLSSVLPQHWRFLVGSAAQGAEAAQDPMQAVFLPCSVSSHAAARELGAAAGADLVLWGSAETKVDATARSLSRLFQHGLSGAANASSNTIQMGESASLQINAQQSFRVELTGDLQDLSLKTSITWVQSRGLVPAGPRGLQRGEGFIASSIDFPRSTAERPLLAVAHTLLGIHALRDERPGIAAAEFQRAQEQLAAGGPGAPELDGLAGISLTLAGRLAGGRAAFESARKRCGSERSRCQAAALHNQAWGYRQQGEGRKALAGLQQALLSWRLSGKDPEHLETWLQLGQAYEDAGDLQKARETYQQAIALSTELQEPAYLADAYMRMGLFQVRHGDPRRALASYDLALKTSLQSADRPGQVVSHANRGLVLEEMERLPEARAAYQLALKRSDDGEAPGRRAEAVLLGSLGRVLRDTQREPSAGSFQRALALHVQTLERREDTRDLAGAAATLCDLSAVRADSGDGKEALRAAEQGLRYSQRIGDRRGLLRARWLAARAAVMLGRYQAALTELELADALSEALQDRPMQASIRLEMGKIFSLQKNIPRATSTYQQVVQLSQQLGLHAVQLDALSALGRAALERGQPQEALQAYQRVQQLAQALGRRSRESSALVEIGRLQAERGLAQEAQDAYQQALALNEQAGDVPGQVAALSALAEQRWLLGRPAQALASYDRAVTLCSQLNDPLREVALLSNRGTLRCASGQFVAGLADLERAQALGASSQAPPSLARAIWQSVAACHLAAGQIPAGQSALRQAGALMPQRPSEPTDAAPGSLAAAKDALAAAAVAHERSQRLGCVPWGLSTLAELGGAHEQLGRPADALAAYQRMLTRSQALRDRLHEAEARGRLGQLHARQGHLKQAAEQLRIALGLAKELGDERTQTGVLVELGSVMEQGALWADARGYYEQAQRQANTVGAAELEAAALMGLGRIAAAEDAPGQKAESYFQRAIEIFDKLGLTAEAERAHAELSAIKSPAERAYRARMRWLKNLKPQSQEDL